MNAAIRENLARLAQTIQESALRAGRAPEAIKLVAVSKTMPVTAIQEALNCGQTVFGENYLQEAQQKIPLLNKTCHWHYIGRLQSKKCREIVQLFDVVETVDRVKTAKLLDEHAAGLCRQLDVLVQVNIGEEPQKAGVMPDKLEALLQVINQCGHLHCLGLMALPPFCDNPEASRPYFRRLRLLGERYAAQGLFFNNQEAALSMGMSGDYSIAIEEGATFIRVGSAIFGPRHYEEENT